MRTVATAGEDHAAPAAPAPAPATPGGTHFAAGDVVAERYRVVRFIARGAMGEVYEVEDRALGARVALKALRAHLVADDDASERFRREILLARQVAHPNVCRIFDLAVHRAGAARLPVLTMELLTGRTLAERLRSEGKLDPDAALPLVRQIAAGLAEAHRLGIVHRDLKSANVILEEGTRPRVVVTDFGLARTVAAPDESQAGSVVGTPAYMAPEQLAGGPITPATDVYALGVVICEMLTGHLAGDRAGAGGKNAASQLRAEVAGAGATIPPVWRRVVDRCLAFNPAGRFGSMDEVVAALRGPRAPSVAPQVTHGERVGRYRVLRPAAVAGLYRARDATAGRTVAVQPLSAELSVGPERLERLAEELRGFQHPALAPVLELDAHDGAPVVVLDAIEGRTLAAALASGPLPAPRAYAVAAALAGALGVAHDRGVVVGDLRADRVLLGDDGRPQLVDVGAARLAAAVGLDPPNDAAADLRSLGALLVEMLAGHRVDDATGLAALPPEARAVVARRWQSAHDLAFHLEATGRALAGRRRRRLLFTAAGSVGLVAAVAATALLAPRARTGAPPAAGDGVTYQRITFHHGTVGGARFAADGRTVVYATARDGEPLRVHTTVPGSFTSRALTDGGFDLAALSAGGELALFHDARGKRVLARMALASAAPRDVAENVLLADWTPRGELAVVRSEGGKRIVEMPPGHAIYSTASNISALRVAPAGDRVAIAEHPIEYDDAGRVVAITAAGAATPLTDLRWGVVRGVAWRDDGREVWFFAQEKGSRSGLYAAGLDGALRSVLILPFAARLLDVRGDAALLSFENVTIRAFARSGAGPARDLSWLDYSLVTDVSQDGANLVISEGSMGASDDYEIYLRPTDGGPAVNLGTGYSTQFSPDGSRVLVFRRDGDHHRMVLVPTGAGEPRELPRGPITTYHQIVAGFFPDGKRVVFMGKAGGDWRVWEQDVAGGDPRPLTPEGWHINRGAIVSPDGDHVILVAPKWKRVLRTLSTGEDRPIPGLEDKMVPSRFSPDGQSLLVWWRDRQTLHVDRLDLTTGARVAVSTAELDGDMWTGMWVTPDGETAAYSARRLQHTLMVASGLR